MRLVPRALLAAMPITKLAATSAPSAARAVAGLLPKFNRRTGAPLPDPGPTALYAEFGIAPQSTMR